MNLKGEDVVSAVALIVDDSEEGEPAEGESWQPAGDEVPGAPPADETAGATSEEQTTDDGEDAG
jgi:hypothetical protein